MMDKEQFKMLEEALIKIREITDNEKVCAMSYSCFGMIASNGFVEKRNTFYSCGLISRYFVSGVEIFVHPEMPKDTFCIMTRKEYEDLKNEIIIE